MGISLHMTNPLSQYHKLVSGAKKAAKVPSRAFDAWSQEEAKHNRNMHAQLSRAQSGERHPITHAAGVAFKFVAKHHPPSPIPTPHDSRKLLQASGLPQMASDAKWSVTHPRDRMMGRGRARGTLITSGPFKGKYMLQNIMPVAGSGGAGMIPGEFKSSIPGMKILRSKPGDTRLTWEGSPETYTRDDDFGHHFFEPEDYVQYIDEKHGNLSHFKKSRLFRKLQREHNGTQPVNYNLYHEGMENENGLVGSVGYALHPKHVYAGEVFIEPGTDIRAFKDFADIITRHKKPIEANFANERLGELFDKLVARGKVGRAKEDLTEMELWDLNRQLTAYQASRPAMHSRTALRSARRQNEMFQTGDEFRNAVNELRLAEPPHGHMVNLSPGGRPINRRRSGR